MGSPIRILIHGMAHITGGGIEGNLCARIVLSKLRIHSISKYIRNIGNISDEEMLRTFNCGAGFVIVVPQKEKQTVREHIARYNDCYEIGEIAKGNGNIEFEYRINWL